MPQRRILSAVGAGTLMLVLTACNLGKSPEPTADVNALYTAAAETLIVQYGQQQTQTAEAVTDTPTASPTSLASPSPFPTFALAAGVTPFGTLTLGATPLPTSAAPAQFSNPVGCDDAQYIGGDPADGKKFDLNKQFVASWSMLNVGTCTWDEGYNFAFKSGDRLSGNNVVISTEAQFTKPGHSQAFVIHMQAPNKPGEYKGFWQMRNDAGVWFGSLVWVSIVAN